jgi:RNA polymerase sigma-70 factor (ECF subfamily)
VDAISPQPAGLVLPLPAAQPSGIPPGLLQELWLAADAESCGLTLDEFHGRLASVCAKFNFGLPPGEQPGAAQKAGFLRSLRLGELALAYSCALGREAAWQRFLLLYRTPLTKAAVAITGSATLGNDLADSLYSELYGLRQVDGERRSPLESYSSRGSLLGWLRTTLAQRHVDHHRRTHREFPLDTVGPRAPERAPDPVPAELTHLAGAVALTLQGLSSEDRFLLSSYFLDRRTLLDIARVLDVHEATVSRRIKRLTAHVRKRLLENLESGGMRKGDAERALGTDPRDIEINVRALLQSSQTSSFSDQA